MSERPTLLVSPMEPRVIRTMGTTSPLPESLGCDIVFSCAEMGGLVGIQRKEVSDFLQSVQDGRLGHGTQKMRGLKLAILIIEGRMRWSTSNRLLLPANYQSVTKAAWRSMLRSCQHAGMYLDFSEDIPDTIVLIDEIRAWASKGEHNLLNRRPNPGKSAWGDVSDEAWQMHVLQSFEGLGPKQARAVIEHFGGLPLMWTVTADELKQVRGLGPKRIQNMLRGLQQDRVDKQDLVAQSG